MLDQVWLLRPAAIVMKLIWSKLCVDSLWLHEIVYEIFLQKPQLSFIVSDIFLLLCNTIPIFILRKFEQIKACVGLIRH